MNSSEIIKNYLDTLKIGSEIKTIEDVNKLIRAHLRTFSFSSLRVLLKEEISLELSDIYENIVLKRRGGYCFEHNKLMYEALKELGFNVTHFLARVVNNTDIVLAKTHRFTLLDFEDEKYLIDVGIGFRSPNVAVKFGDEPSVSSLGIEYKIVELEDKVYSMQLVEDAKPFNVTKFDLNKCYEVDFDMGNFYSYKNPKAVFVNNFVASLIRDNVIFSLVNNKYLKIYKDKIEEAKIENTKQLQQILEDDLNSKFTSKEIEFFYENYLK